MTTKTITISGGFHNAGTLTIRAKINAAGTLALSGAQLHKIRNSMCGISDCQCGGMFDIAVAGIGEQEFRTAIENAEYAAWAK